MSLSKINLTYVFGAGRLKKINSSDLIAKEFFYGYFSMSEKYNCNIVEMNFPHEKNNIFLKTLDKVLRKLTRFPIYTKDILSFENFKKLKSADKLILTTDLLAFSLLPFLMIIKIFKRIDIYVIAMGLYGRNSQNVIIKLFQGVYMFLLHRITNSFIFLGKGEYIKASNLKKKFENKFVFLPFSVDTHFWKEDKSVKYIDSSKEGVLFIGNDGKRDFDLVQQIADEMPNIRFTLITKQISKSNSENVELISGSWGENTLSDEEIKDYYIKSKITIIPLRETIQPSGQSVALQSMSCGTPVMITKTEGFWDEAEFKDEENIIFVNSKMISDWKDKINKLYFDDLLLEKISINSTNTIMTKYNLNAFSKNLEKIISN